MGGVLCVCMCVCVWGGGGDVGGGGEWVRDVSLSGVLHKADVDCSERQLYR